MVLKKRPVLPVAIGMTVISLLSPLWVQSYGSVDYYSIMAVLWRLERHSSYSYIVFADGYQLLTNVLILGMPNLIFAALVVRLVAGKTSRGRVLLLGIISATWIDIMILVSYLPYILSPSPYPYLPVMPIPVPIQLILGLAIAWLYQPKVDDSIWREETEEETTEPKKADWLGG